MVPVQCRWPRTEVSCRGDDWGLRHWKKGVSLTEKGRCWHSENENGVPPFWSEFYSLQLYIQPNH